MVNRCLFIEVPDGLDGGLIFKSNSRATQSV